MDKEIELLIVEIKRLGEYVNGVTRVKFGVLVRDERIGDILEGLVMVLKAGRRKGIFEYNSEILLQGVSDDVLITLPTKGVILVGGPSGGTRFRPLSMDCPKPLFPIAGNALIYHHVVSLQKVPGMKEILLIGYYEAGVFDRFLSEIQLEFPSLSIRYLREYQSLGTAGGLYHFKDEILRGSTKYFYVLNADIASSFPLTDLLYCHLQHKGIATVMTTRVEKEQACNYGCLATHPSSNEVIHFVHKPVSFLSDLISCGVYIFNDTIFSKLSEAKEVKAIAEQDEGTTPLDCHFPSFTSEYLKLEIDVFPLLIKTNSLFSFTLNPLKDFWMQLKTGSATLPANRAYLQYFLQAIPRRLSKNTAFHSSVESDLGSQSEIRPKTETIEPVFIHPTALIHPGAKIGPNVSIGPRALISRGVRIRDAIILDNTEVRHDACIINAVVGWNSKIGSWARIEGAPMGESTHEDATIRGYKNPSAALLGKDVVVADEVIIRNCIVLPNKELRKSFQNEILM